MWADEGRQGRGKRAELLSQCGLKGRQLVDRGGGCWGPEGPGREGRA